VAAKNWQFLLGYLIFVAVMMVVMQSFLSTPSAATIAYSDFKILLRAGRIKDVLISGDAVEGTANIEGAEKLLSDDTLKSIRQPQMGGTNFFPLYTPVPPNAAAPANAAAPSQGRSPASEQPEVGPRRTQAPRGASAPAAYRVKAQRVDDPQLVADLEAQHVHYAALKESHWPSTLISYALWGLIFLLAMRFLTRGGITGGTGSLMAVGQSKAKVYVQSETGVHFADVAGIDEAKAELMEVVEFLRNPERFRRLGGKIPKGVLIVGAPGTGKTMLAKAVAGEAGVAFLSISGSEFVEMFVGVGAARVRDLFAQAEQRAPCIIFIDELDALGKARGFNGYGGHDEREQTLNQLLVEMDGFDTRKGVIIMAATNRPEILDPALLRPGRFDRHVAIDRPDIKGREQILQVHVRNVTLAPGVGLREIAAKTAGFVGADLANIVNEAALRAARLDKSAVEMEDFDEAIDRVVGGLEKRNRVMNPLEKETVAYHEAGHALVAELRPHADRVSKISIIPRGIAALGYTRQLPTEDRYLLKRSELLDRLDVLLGGRVAEELVLEDVSTGAQDDLQRATDMARHMVTQYGMSTRLGQVTFDAPPQGAFLDPPAGTPARGAYSNETAQLIDEEIATLLREAHERVMRTLTEQRSTLDQLARLLLQHEVVEREMLDKLLSGARPAAPVPSVRTLATPAAA